MWSYKRNEITIFLLLIKMFVSEARVFCQDEHAKPWTSVGPPCAVTCRTIVTAVERLKQIDYEYLFDEDIRSKIQLSLPEINNMSLHLQQPVYARNSKNLQEKINNQNHFLKEPTEKIQKEPLYLAGDDKNSRQNLSGSDDLKKKLLNISNMEEHENLSNKRLSENVYLKKDSNLEGGLENLRINSNLPEELEASSESLSKDGDLKKELSEEMSVYKNLRQKLSEEKYLKKELLKMAGELTDEHHRRFGRTALLRKFVSFLNKYAKANYTFDDDFASALVDKFENELNLRFGESTFKNLFMYLVEAMSGQKTKRNLVIRLKPTNCIPLFMPGCFCQKGYVEYNGKCVEASECLLSKTFVKYLQRIEID